MMAEAQTRPRREGAAAKDDSGTRPLVEDNGSTETKEGDGMLPRAKRREDVMQWDNRKEVEAYRCEDKWSRSGRHRKHMSVPLPLPLWVDPI